jgi:hypothetical protein
VPTLGELGELEGKLGSSSNLRPGELGDIEVAIDLVGGSGIESRAETRLRMWDRTMNEDDSSTGWMERQRLS